MEERSKQKQKEETLEQERDSWKTKYNDAEKKYKEYCEGIKKKEEELKK